jgi:hypothetical protein
MDDHDLQVVEKVSGSLQAEILRGLLESHGIQVWVRQESAAKAIGLGVGPLASVDLLVRRNEVQAAQRVLEDYRRGRLSKD